MARDRGLACCPRLGKTRHAFIDASEPVLLPPSGGGEESVPTESSRMNINREWHLKNRMPKNPSVEQRIAWHISHAEHCSCRTMPASIRCEIAKRGLTLAACRNLSSA